jgi:2,3,4,5-tetrahydropyridine-2-carboxylate N-succinyltransferase
MHDDVRRADLIRTAYAAKSTLSSPQVRAQLEPIVSSVIADLNDGRLRVADNHTGVWRTHAWIKEAILLYFSLRPIERLQAGDLDYFDRIPLRRDHAKANVRVVPPGVARYGSHLEPGVILMPGYVNIGAYVGAGTLIDTFATVGSCAQIGRNVHLSGGVGIGGVLEPPQASPVIVEDGAFIGSRCILVEGVHIEREAVLGANVVLTASTPIIDVTGPTQVLSRGRIPARSVVIPGTYPKQFPAGTYHVPCALLIGQRTASTDQKTSLNEALRTFEISP